MTTHEQQLLESLLDRIENTPAPQRDPQAEALIRERIGTRTDALYLLTQTVLIEDIALKQANARIQELQQQLQSHGEPQHTSFLGRLFGTSPGSRPILSPAPQSQSVPPSAQYAQQQSSPPQGYTPVPQPGSGSSFLRSAATTATGVAAGALAFEGIESLLHPQHGLGGGFGEGGGFLDGTNNETVINNYYGSPPDDRRDALADTQHNGADDSSDPTDPSGSTDVRDDSWLDDSGFDDDNA